MKSEDNKKGPSGYPDKDLPGKLKNEKNNNCKEEVEINEADDKLIGDDLDIEKAGQVKRDKEIRSENEGSNY